MLSSKSLLFYSSTFRSGIYFCLWCEVGVTLGWKTVSQRHTPLNSWNCYLLRQSVFRVIKVKVLSKKDYSGLSTTTCILAGGKQRAISHTEAPMRMEQTEIDLKLLALWLDWYNQEPSNACNSRDGKRQITFSLTASKVLALLIP